MTGGEVRLTVIINIKSIKINLVFIFNRNTPIVVRIHVRGSSWAGEAAIVWCSKTTDHVVY